MALSSEEQATKITAAATATTVDAATTTAAAAAQVEAEAKTALWSLAATILSIRAIVPITLDLQTSNYPQWCRMFTDALQKYTLEDHLLASAYPANPTPQWSRLDAIV
ncbi:hypothetical protein GUJ93_ZPchr0013g36949 [Zizania palustris]|uniref:Uncharacterized protein n=1 Tax=Zizania palustris TaxID=103762 RepID=A0A8J5X280_ZIZPA|nr:hypothetical protein GUJ93_ZPchr0013g36949 [Zizania palustris]